MWGRQAVADLQIFAEQGLVATDFDSLDGQWATTGPSWYLLAEALWHGTEFDFDSAMDDYCVAAFGTAAARAGRKYWDFWESLDTSWTSDQTRLRMRELSALPPYLPPKYPVPTEANKLGRVRVMPMIYTLEILERGGELLANVLTACESDGCRRRVTFFGLGLKHAQLLREALLARRANTTAIWSCSDSAACDYAAILPAATALLRFRKQHAADNALAMYYMSREETAYADITGVSIAAEVARLPSSVGTARVRLPIEVSVAFDPLDHGLEQGWFDTTHRGGNWSSAAAGPTEAGGLGWNASAAGQEWFKAHGQPYTGVGWYRFGFSLPVTAARENFSLASMGITGGSVRLWLNGKPLVVAGGGTDTPFVAALPEGALMRPWNPLAPQWNSHCLSAAACEARYTTENPFRIKTCNETEGCAKGTGVEPAQLTCQRELVTCQHNVCMSDAVNGTLCVEPAAQRPNLLVVRIDARGTRARERGVGSPGLTNMLWLTTPEV